MEIKLTEKECSFIDHKARSVLPAETDASTIKVHVDDNAWYIVEELTDISGVNS